ncbi:MAG: hypothetical protein E7589_04775 [Ruminococcaceae bacterium]|nr:hypothetical protein [Oscillospiraceae bacterium]
MKSKTPEIILIFSFCFILFFGMISYVTSTSPDFSEDENRVLAALPHYKRGDVFTAWSEGKLSRQLSSYFSDRLALRRQLVGMQGAIGAALGGGASRGVAMGGDGQLATYLFDAYLSPTRRASRSDFFLESHIAEQCAAVKRLANKLQKQNIDLCFLPAPRVVDVCAASLNYPAQPSDELMGLIKSRLTDTKNLAVIDMLSPLRWAHGRGEYVMYRTDHHWTAEGAYMAYLEIMATLSPTEKPLAREDFSARKIENFIGTTASRACIGGTPLCRPDVMEIWEREDDQSFIVRDGNGFEMHGFIDEKFLSGKDKYGALLGGTRNYLEIFKTDKNGAHVAGRPHLLVVKDSFANSVIPLLARHFDITAVHLSGGMTDVSKYARECGADAVLILYNLENMVTADHLNRVK